jgi:hypothetical protein
MWAMLLPLLNGPEQSSPIFVEPIQFECLVSQIDRVQRPNRIVFVNYKNCTSTGLKYVRFFTAPSQSNPIYLFSITSDQYKCLIRYKTNPKAVIFETEDGKYRYRSEICPP